MYICPVCGYEKLDEQPMNFSICSCCGTEFEYDDFDTPYATLRARWAANGYRWFSRIVPPPEGWNPLKQLGNLQYAQTPVVSTTARDNPPLSVRVSGERPPAATLLAV